jgi:basic membrane protein A
MGRQRGRYTSFALAVLAALVLTLAAACGGDDETAATTEAAAATTEEAAATTETAAATTDEAATGAAVEVTQIAIATPEKANDFGWNQQGVEGAQAAAEAHGAEIEVADGIGYEDVGSVLQQLAEGGAQFIIPHASGYNTVGPETAVAQNVPMVVHSNPDAETPGLVADIEIRNQGGSYLAGALAAQTTQTNTLGIVLAADIPDFWRLAGGFVAGARSVNPDIEIQEAVIGATGFADTAGGKRVTDTLISAGADVIFGMGDGATLGMIQSVETATPPEGADQVWFIDIHGDKTSLDENGVYLTSVYTDFTPVFEQAIADIEAGTFGTQSYELNLSNGISLLQTDHIPEDVWADLQELQTQIEDGSVEVPEVTSEDQFSQLLES